MANILSLAQAVSTAATATGTGVALNTTPFLGGQGHEAILNIVAPAASVTVKIQGNPAANYAGAPVPAAGDAGWVDIVSLTSASPLQQEIKLPNWIRYNITGAAAGTFSANLEGVH